jgi:hypothetical protein
MDIEETLVKPSTLIKTPRRRRKAKGQIKESSTKRKGQYQSQERRE